MAQALDTVMSRTYEFEVMARMLLKRSRKTTTASSHTAEVHIRKQMFQTTDPTCANTYLGLQDTTTQRYDG
jgi:hypothetical protein